MRKLIFGAAFLAVFIVLVQAGRAQQASPVEVQLLTRISQQPGEMTNYLELAKYYRAQRRFDEAEQLLLRALDLLRDERRTGGVQNPSAIIPTRPSVAAGPPQTGAAGYPPDAPLRVGGEIREPKKIKDVKPVYPAVAQANGVTGIVIIEAIIDRDGYVRDAKVLRSVPMLDDAAVEAVRQWRFTPTFLNGMPVEVIMTTTVNFSLR
jgi:TonB family protein